MDVQMKLYLFKQPDPTAILALIYTFTTVDDSDGIHDEPQCGSSLTFGGRWLKQLHHMK